MSFPRTFLAGSLLFIVAAYAPPARGVVEAISKADPPSDTVLVFPGPLFRGAEEPRSPSYTDVSATGRFVLFRSNAKNVLPGRIDPSNGDDLFLRDRQLGETTLVSRIPGTDEPMNNAAAGRISEDGSTVLFEDSIHRVYLYDRYTRTTRFVANSFSYEGIDVRATSADGSWSVIAGQEPTTMQRRLYLYEKSPGTLHTIALPEGCFAEIAEISADGRVVVFERNCAADVIQVVAYDRITQVFSVVPSAWSRKGNISRDGRYVIIRSAPILPGLIDTDPFQPDVFRYDWLSQEVILVNRGSSPLESSSFGGSFTTARISDDGSVIALPKWYGYGLGVLHVSTGVFQEVPPSDEIIPYENVALSGDGRTLAYSTLTKIVVVATQTMNARVVSSTNQPGVGPNDYTHHPVISRDGSLVVFASRASNLGIGINDFDREPGFQTRASLYGVDLHSDRVEALSLAGNPSRVQATLSASSLFLSGNGERAVFHALPNAARFPDASIHYGVPIMRDRQTDVALRIGESEYSYVLAFSEDGTTAVVWDQSELYVYPRSDVPSITPLSPGWASVDASGKAVVYSDSSEPLQGRRIVNIWNPPTGLLTRVSKTASGGVPNGDSAQPVISADGRFVAFQSLAGDLLPGLPFAAGQANVFLYDVITGAMQLVSVAASGLPVGGVLSPESGRVLSKDGRYLLLTTSALTMGDLVLPAGSQHVVLFDRVLGRHILASGVPPTGLPVAEAASMDASGRYVVFQRKGIALNGAPTAMVFLFDRETGSVERVLAPVNGHVPYESVPRISADGSTIAVQAEPSGVPQAYVVDRRTRRVSLASHGAGEATLGNDISIPAALDAAGNVLLFMSAANNLGLDLGYTAGRGEYTGEYRFLLWSGGAAFAFTTPAIVYSISPNCASVSGGRTVTIEGAHFKPGSTVTLDGIPATVTNLTSTAITAVTGARAPTTARTGNVEVRSPDGEYFALGSAFTYAVRGDANNSGALTAADGFYLNMALFLGGPQPASLCNGDANGSGATTSADAFFLNLYLFLGGAPPPP